MRAVLLAAGSARRMQGRDKLLEPVQGQPLLRVLALRLLVSGVAQVAVTLRADDPARRAALAGLTVTTLPVPDADTGMSASLRVAGAWALGDDLLVCPADMPDLTADDFRACVAAFDGQSPLRATDADGTPGHPVIFPARLLGLFKDLTGDEGARPILRAHPPSLLALPGTHATTDLDTPQDWAAWRSITE